MSGNARAAVGSVTKLDRATVIASCGEEPRQFVHARREVDATLSASGHVFQERGVGIRFAAEADYAHGNPERFESIEQPLVLARFLRVGRVREQDDVSGALVGLLDDLRCRDQRGVGEDAAAHGLNASHLVADPVLVAGRGQRGDHMRRTVDGNDGDLVERPERLDRRAGPQIRQVHLGSTVAGRRGHAAGTIEHHRHRQRQLAMLVLDFHRHRQKRIEHGLEIAAHAERRRAAGQEQSSAEVGDEPRQRSERLRAGLASRYVLQDDRAKSQQAGRILRHLRRPDRADAQLAGRQGTAQVVRPSAGVDHQDRRRRFDAHGAVAPVVLGDAIAPGRELQPVAGDAGPIDEVPKRQLGGARLKAACGARNLDAVTQQDGLGVDRAIGAHRRGELKRLPLVDHAGQVERFDGDVRRLAAAEHPEVDRQAARRRFVCCPHHRRSVRLAVREHDQPAAPLARDQTGGKTDRTSQVAAVAVHLLHERARLTELLGQPLDARLASVGHDSDSIARRAPLLEQR